MVEKSSKAKRAASDRKLTQKAFENKADREMKGVVRKTERMADAICQSGIEGTGSNPPMAKSEPGEARGKKGKKLPTKEGKK
jgi:hypothetical protein